VIEMVMDEELTKMVKHRPKPGRHVVSSVAPNIIRQRIEGIVERTNRPMPPIRIRQEAHEIDIPDIKIEAPTPIPAPMVCEAKLLKRPDMVKINTDFEFEFSVKNCGNTPGDFEVVVVLSKTGAAAMEKCLSSREYALPRPVAQLYESGTSELPAYGVTPPHVLCGPTGTYPTFHGVVLGVQPGETKHVTVVCKVGKEYTGRTNVNVRAWARLVSPPQTSYSASVMQPGVER